MGDHEAAALSDKLASCDPGSLEHIDLLNELASLRLSQVSSSGNPLRSSHQQPLSEAHAGAQAIQPSVVPF